MELAHLYISAGHNFFGHHNQPPGENRMMEVVEVQCRAGRGLEGDRFFNYQENYKGQITFFAEEVHQALCEQLQVWNRPPWAFRRNVITRAVDLNSLIGLEFEIQGVQFRGVEECKACHWMNQAFHPGAEQALQGRGGLRAQILTDGILRLMHQATIADAGRALSAALG